MRTSQTNLKLDKRLQSIINTLTYQIYAYGTIGMFEKHKLLYSFLLTIQIDLDAGKLRHEQIEFFLKGNVALDTSASIKSKPDALWLTHEAWHQCSLLAERFPERFHALLASIRDDDLPWKQWLEHEQTENQPLPEPFQATLNEFERLMLLRCFRPNRIIFAMNHYVATAMGEKYLVPPTIHFDSILEQASSTTPVMFVLSPGSDPTNDIQKLAERKLSTNDRAGRKPMTNENVGMPGEVQRSLRVLAMGQGQERVALQALHAAQHQGTWLLLQNCHLLVPFLNELENELEASKKSHVIRSSTRRNKELLSLSSSRNFVSG